MTQPAQPNALDAITAALTGGQTKAQPAVVTPATLPMQQAPFPSFASTVAPMPTGQQPLPASPHPFQPSTVQAAAMFAAAVPQAAQTHAHPSTGAAFAPINPPGEAASAPTAGLDAAPVQVVQTHTPPEVTQTAPAVEPPKAPRQRKTRVSQAVIAAAESNARQANEMLAYVAGDGAAANAEASAAPSGTGPQSYTLEKQLAFATVEELTAELKRRGFRIGLSVE